MKIKCPSCQSTLNVPDAAAGKVVKCPCGKQLRAPGGVAPSVPDAMRRPSGAPPARPTPRAAGNDHGFDAAMFDELTTDDLVPVRSVSNPGRPSMGGGTSATGNKLLHQYGSSSSGSMGRTSMASNRIAGVGQRISGAILDGVFVMFGVAVGFGLSFAAVATLGPPAVDTPPFQTPAFWFIILGSLIPTIINAVLLSKSGQTLGKKAVGTVIVDRDSGIPVGFVQGILRRNVLFGFITSIPVIGSLIALANLVYLFVEDHRTLHDRLAGTIVVEV